MGVCWGALLLTARPVWSQVLLEVILVESDVIAFTGGTDSDPICLESLEDGRLVFFDTEPGVDAMILFDPAQSGVSRLSVIASEAELLALAPNTVSPGNISVSDIAFDDTGDLFAVVSETTGGPDYDNFIVSIPASGGAFAPPTLATDLFDGGKSGLGEFVYHRVETDPLGDRLFILYDSLDDANDTASTPGMNGVHVFDLADMPGTTADLSMLAPYVSMAAVFSPPATPGTDSIGLLQIRVSPDGSNLYGVNTNGSGSNDGDVVRIDTSDGSFSLFLDQDIAETQTANIDQFTTRTALAVHPTAGTLALLEVGTTDPARENLHEYRADGTFLGIAHSHDQITDALPSVGSDFSMTFTNAMVIDPTGDTFLWLTQETETLVRAHSTLTHPLAGTGPWIWPILASTSPSLTSGFGPRRYSAADPRYDWHRGLDIPLPIGSRVYASADGTIRLSGPTAGFTDPVVQVQHGAGTTARHSTNLHMSGWPLTVGTPVSQGALVGLSGTSSSYFDHLHFEVRDGGTNQRHCQNPMGYLSTANTPPGPPALTGANLATTEAVMLFDVATPRTEIDLDGMTVTWGADSATLSFDLYNSAHTGAPEELDHPPLGLAQGVATAVLPGRTSTDYLYRFAFWGLDAGGVAGTAVVNDVHGAGPPVALSPDLPPLTLSPPVQTLSTPPGGTAVFTHTLRNTGPSPLALTLSAQSAQSNSLSVAPDTVNLAVGESRAVTVTVLHSASLLTGIGDCVALEVDDASSAQRLVAIDLIGDPVPPPAGVPVGLSLLGAH
ncbi:M23 family metallopeptidase [Candidatus Sumerlaeota bacterium]|nr:M23 family metallopeptidase [Candidatus Sumerlaeota bacterium]